MSILKNVCPMIKFLLKFTFKELWFNADSPTVWWEDALANSLRCNFVNSVWLLIPKGKAKILSCWWFMIIFSIRVWKLLDSGSNE